MMGLSVERHLALLNDVYGVLCDIKYELKRINEREDKKVQKETDEILGQLCR